VTVAERIRHCRLAVSPPLSLSAITDARAALDGLLHVTPLLSSSRTSERAGVEVLLKAELFQRTGSFKPRGAFARLLLLSPEERRRGVIAASSGNHAQALAYCARALGIDCLAIMWRGASEHKIAAVRAYGAHVDLEAANGAEALERANELAERTGRIVVHAYDDDAVMAGQGTLGLEILDQTNKPDAVLVPVSGGGLLAGVGTAIKATRSETRVIAVEPAASPSLSRALDAGRPVRTPEGSIADGLAAPQIGERCLRVIQGVIDDIVSVSDSEIRDATRWLYQAAKLACEPAGAATTAALLARRPIPLEPHYTAVAIVSGGNIDPETLARVMNVTRPD
jgi:threonine dehydratase